MSKPLGPLPIGLLTLSSILVETKGGGTVKLLDAKAENADDTANLANLILRISEGTGAAAPMLGAQSPKRTATLSEVWQRYMEGKSGIAPTSKVAYTQSYKLFEALIGGGHRLFHEIADQELLDFVDALALVPMNANKRRIKIGTIAELRELRVRAEDGEMVEPERISATTKNSHRNRIKDFVADAIRAGYRLGPNPIADSRRHSDGNEEGGADQFTTSELTRIFAADKLLNAGPVVYWGLLMALYTGARINEIATLELNDFISEGDVLCICISHTPKAAKSTIHLPRNSPAKRTKNKSSQRLVPLSPQLLTLGLDDYLDDLRSLGFTRMFPTLPKDNNGQRKAKLSEDGNNYLREVGVHVVRTKVLHSFRDTMEGILGHSGMDDVRVDQWMGRKSKTIKGKHYRAETTVSEQAAVAFPVLNFPFIDQEALKYPKGKWNRLLQEKQKP